MIPLIPLKNDDIPEHFCVIRIKDTSTYLHYKEDMFYFKERIHGCFVCLPEVSDEILNKLQGHKSFANLEVVKFKNAYKEHGIIEKQIAYN